MDKISDSKIDFHKELLDYFWNCPNLQYRGLIAKGKDQLDHARLNDGDYDLLYYKMYFCLLDPIIDQDGEYYIFLDTKDTAW